MAEYISRLWCDIPNCIGYATHITDNGTKLCRRHTREKKRMIRKQAMKDA